ncbi:hypothetical protein J4232_00825 [Candidatus Woesearchaeota archaeon]|nr:hypothetical protein [Candidatus Woesearchaeota archaeon]
MKSRIPLIAILSSLAVICITTNKIYEERTVDVQTHYVQLSPEKEKITLAIAKADPTKRQAYIDGLVADTKIPFCNGIIYEIEIHIRLIVITKQQLAMKQDIYCSMQKVCHLNIF